MKSRRGEGERDSKRKITTTIIINFCMIAVVERGSVIYCKIRSVGVHYNYPMHACVARG